MNAATICCFLAFLSAGSAMETSLSPITRVVGLMKDLSAQVEKDGKMEEDDYESWMCWGKKTIKTKTESNAAGADRVIYLQQFIEDAMAAAGNERKNALSKQINGLLKDAEDATSMREKENSEYLAAYKEMTQAITALGSAIKTLTDATSAHKQGSLLAVKSSLSHGMAALQEQQLNMRHAAELGDRFLDKADAFFLRQLITGEGPGDVKPDMAKLHSGGKAGFKMKYKARSFKIQNLLNKMQFTFLANRQEAEAKEQTALGNYNTLFHIETGSKTAMRKKAQQDLSAVSVNSADANEEWSESVVDKEKLEFQIENDAKILEKTKADMIVKTTEYKERMGLRANEQAAISSAINTLTSDEARDKMKKSFSSQSGGFLFFQTAQTYSSAAHAIRQAALKTGNQELLSFAKLMREENPGAFAAVVTKIGEMITKMGTDEANDLSQVQACESDRTDQGRIAVVAARQADYLTDEITVLKREEAELTKVISDLNVDRQKGLDEKAAAIAQRVKDKAAYDQSVIDDNSAKTVVTSALHTLETFYGITAKGSFLETDSSEEAAQEPTSVNARAKHTSEASGILNMLKMIITDITDDIGKATKEEQASIGEHSSYLSAQNAVISDLRGQITTAEAKLGEKVTTRGQKNTEKTGQQGTLKTADDVKIAATKGCDYFTVNFDLRAKNRAVELDGLRQAKAALSGSKFGLLELEAKPVSLRGSQ